MRTHDPVDIVTIGGGMTASVLAALILPTTGVRMVSIEQGRQQWTYPDFAHNHDTPRFNNRYAMMHDITRSTWTWRPNADAPALPMRQYGSFHPGKGLGGAMVHWTALTWRFLPDDFHYRTVNETRYGRNRFPEEMTVQDRPIDYDDLEPYYDAFEYDIGVSGQAGNLRRRIMPGGNPYEGPRRRPHPNPPLARGAFGELFTDGCRDLGLHLFPTPAGILSRGWTDPYGNVRSSCLYCGFCTRSGARWKSMLRDSWDSVGELSYEADSPAYAGNFLDLDPTYRDVWGRPPLRITFDFRDNERHTHRFIADGCEEIARAMGADEVQVERELGDYRIDEYQSTHPTGGAVMGTDPGNSVTNGHGQVWDIPNVFVTGAALYPQNPGANPTGTVGALAFRTAEALANRYFNTPGELLV